MDKPSARLVVTIILLLLPLNLESAPRNRRHYQDFESTSGSEEEEDSHSDELNYGQDENYEDSYETANDEEDDCTCIASIHIHLSV